MDLLNSLGFLCLLAACILSLVQRSWAMALLSAGLLLSLL